MFQLDLSSDPYLTASKRKKPDERHGTLPQAPGDGPLQVSWEPENWDLIALSIIDT